MNDDVSSRPTTLFGRVATLAVLAGCVLPFAFYRVTGFEPYPAIIFPGGASRVPVTAGSVGFSSLSLLAYDEHGELTALDVPELLDPIPSSVVDALAATSFGQNDATEFDLWFSGVRWRISGIPRHAPSDDERRAAREWLAGKIADQGLDASRLVVRYVWVTVDYEGGSEIARRTLDEVVYDLD